MSNAGLEPRYMVRITDSCSIYHWFYWKNYITRQSNTIVQLLQNFLPDLNTLFFIILWHSSNTDRTVFMATSHFIASTSRALSVYSPHTVNIQKQALFYKSFIITVTSLSIHQLSTCSDDQNPQQVIQMILRIFRFSVAS